MKNDKKEKKDAPVSNISTVGFTDSKYLVLFSDSFIATPLNDLNDLEGILYHNPEKTVFGVYKNTFRGDTKTGKSLNDTTL